jgi:hypothetical protein
MIAFMVIIAMVVGTAAIGFQAGKASPDTKNIFTSIEEKNGL